MNEELKKRIEKLGSEISESIMKFFSGTEKEISIDIEIEKYYIEESYKPFKIPKVTVKVLE